MNYVSSAKSRGKGEDAYMYLRSGSFVVVGTGRWWACDDTLYLQVTFLLCTRCMLEGNLKRGNWEAMVKDVMVSLPSRHLSNTKALV